MQPVAEYGEQVLQAEMHLGPYRLVKHLRQGGMASVYLVMPYLPGGTLEDMLNEDLLTLEEARAVLEQLTATLAYIHALGILLPESCSSTPD